MTFAHYDPEGFFDEMFTSDGEVRPPYRSLVARMRGGGRRRTHHGGVDERCPRAHQLLCTLVHPYRGSHQFL